MMARKPRRWRTGWPGGCRCRRTLSDGFRFEVGRGGPDGLAWDGFELYFAQQFEAGRADPGGFLTLHFEEERGAGFGERLLFDEREDGWRVFDGEAESIPIGNGDAVRDARRDLAEVEDDGSESAGVEQEVGGFERVAGV